MFRTTSVALFVAASFLAAAQAHAGLSDVVSIGKGRYMIGGRANTVWGSPGKLQAKAMKIAGEYCGKNKPGTEAVLESVSGQRGEPGWGAGGNGFAAGGGARFAETELIFTCEPIAAPESANDVTN